MHLHNGSYEQAHALANQYLPTTDVSDLYIEEAQRLETEGKIEQAAMILTQANDTEMAMVLLKRHRKFDKMLELVKEHKPSHLIDSQITIARQLQDEGDLKGAEQFYVQANVNFYIFYF